MYKIKNKDIRVTPLASFWWFIVNFEQTSTSWDDRINISYYLVKCFHKTLHIRCFIGFLNMRLDFSMKISQENTNHFLNNNRSCYYSDILLCSFIKKRLQRNCFPVNIAKCFKNTFFYRTPPVPALITLSSSWDNTFYEKEDLLFRDIIPLLILNI